MVDENLMARVEALSARVDTLQACIQQNTGRIDRAEENIASVMRQVGIMETVLQGNVKIQEKLSTMIEEIGKALAEFKVTLVEIKMNIDNQASKTNRLFEKVKAVEGQAETLRERGHFDFISWSRKNFVTIVLGIGSLWALVQGIIDAIKK